MFFFEEVNKDNIFKPRSVEHAYLAILNEDLTSAEAVFEAVDSPRARWGKALVGILSNYMEFYPSYFEIRNFYEIDLDFLIKNEKVGYVESLLGSLEYLSKINQEVYKYTARVMYENGYINASLNYMEKSKELFYKDPELHFMLAKYYFKTNQFKLSDYYLSECLSFVPSYYPAIAMKAEIQSMQC